VTMAAAPAASRARVMRALVMLVSLPILGKRCVPESARPRFRGAYLSGKSPPAWFGFWSDEREQEADGNEHQGRDPVDAQRGGERAAVGADDEGVPDGGDRGRDQGPAEGV